jgi:hypothetical protein
MTPKEKAKELLHKMNNVDLSCDNESMCMLYPHAIECSIIAVDEILDSIKKYDILELTDTLYWQEVKEQLLIEKSK